MYCGACGHENSSEHHFCSACGKPLQSGTERPHPNGHYSVILQSAPQDEFERFRIIKQLAGVMKMNEQEASDKIESTPSVVASVGTMAEAEHLQKELHTLGLEVLLRPTGHEDLQALRKDRASLANGNRRTLPPPQKPLKYTDIWSKVLSPGETVEHEFSVGALYCQRGFLALLVLGGGALWLLVWFSAFVGSMGGTDGEESGLPYLLILFVCGLAAGLVRYGYYLKVAYAYALTNRRVLIHQGLFSTRCVSVDYPRITDVIVYEPFYSIFTHTGHVGINTAGTAQVEAVLKHVERPYEVKKILDATREQFVAAKR